MLPLLPFEKIAKKNGVQRITRSALEELRDIMVDHAMEISGKAAKLSYHSKRNTVLVEDVLFVAEKIE